MKPQSSPIPRAALFAATALVLAACTSTRPIPTEPSKIMVREVLGEDPQVTAEPAAVQARRPTIVAVCYNGMVNSDADVLAEAVLACPTGKLTVRDDDVFWTRCPLLQPQRANFICVPEQGPDAAPPPAQ